MRYSACITEKKQSTCHLERSTIENMKQDYPILEFDSTPEAVLEPKRLFDASQVSEKGIICFYQDLIDKLVEQKKIQRVPLKRRRRPLHPIGIVSTFPLYELVMKEGTLLVFYPGIGSSIASAMFEEVIALGCRKFIACGSAGVLDKDILHEHILVPTSAIRDEGISYHYLPPGREVSASKDAVEAIVKTLTSHKLDYLLTKTWTTDAVFRETVSKVRFRMAEGCQVVEMEAASLFAIAQFRNVQLAEILYGSDDVSGSDWNPSKQPDPVLTREKIFWLAVETCLKL